MENKKYLLSFVLVLGLIIIQSTLFHYISPNLIIPDFALMAVVFIGSKKGMIEGQLLGFFSGILEDFATASVPGFNALIKTFLGFTSGILKNKIIFDPIIFPIIFIFIATILKEILACTISYIFLEPDSYPAAFNTSFFIELMLNSLIAPFVYFLLKFFKFIPDYIWSNQK